MRKDTLKTYLKENCPGKQRAVKSADLERALNISGTNLRKLVNRQRQDSIPIGSSRDGYFYCSTAGEVYETVQNLQIMEQGIRAAIQGLVRSLDGFGESGGGDSP